MSKHKTQVTTPPVVPAPTEKPHSELPKVKSPKSTHQSVEGLTFLFDKHNYLLMAIGLVLIIVGYLLMSGGRSNDPNVFDAEAIYSFRRITLSPFIIVLGLVIEAYAIMKRPSN